MSDGPARGGMRVTHASRRFKVVHEKSRTLKELLIRRKRASYTELWALDDVSFEIRPGEAVGIVGRNGSGKSTLLKLLAGIIPPHGGTVEAGGSVASMLELGAGFHPDFTGRENVFMNGAIHGLSDRDVAERLDEIVDFAGLAEFIDMPVRTYSSGMQMRLAFAVASHVEPDIMLLDEVLAVGDEAFQRKCMGRINRFRRDGGTLVFVSHDAAAVEQVCSRALLLSKGRLIGDGPASTILEEYHRFLADETSNAQPEDTEARRQDIALAGSDGLCDEESDGSAQITGWGTRDVAIESLRLLDGTGRECKAGLSGKPLTIRLELAARKPIESPNIGVGIRTTEGVVCLGSSMRLDDVVTTMTPGRWTVDYAIDSLPLREGRFEVFVAVTSWDEATVYHWIDHGLEFSVFSQDVGVGLVAARTSWALVQQEALNA